MSSTIGLDATTAVGATDDDEPDRDVVEPPPPPTTPSRLPAIVGLTALAIYFVFVGTLLRNVKMPDVEWTRTLYLFSGIETIAFAAAGFFFGREVNRARAEVAENRAQTEAKRATTAKKDAAVAETKGKVLTQKIKDLADMTGPPGLMPEGGAGMAPEGALPLRQLAREAERLFPGA